MGTDLHLYIETRNADGKWSAVPTTSDSPYHDGFEGWGDRNYNVFAMLANVRNGHGFAGVQTGDGFEFIAEPRGLPTDISDTLNPELRDEDTDDDTCRPWVGDHSFSWLTAAEVDAFFKVDRSTSLCGWVDVANYIRFARTGRPWSWSGGVSGPGVQHIVEAEMYFFACSDAAGDELRAELQRFKSIIGTERRVKWVEEDRKRIADLEADLRWWSERNHNCSSVDGVYTHVSWPVTYAECAKGFTDWFDKTIRPLMAEHGPENVRLVFGFDS